MGQICGVGLMDTVKSSVINKSSAPLKENFCFTGTTDAGQLDLRN